MSHPVEIPRPVDDPPTLLLRRIDDLVPVVLMLVLGVLGDQLALFLLLGIGPGAPLRALSRQPPGRLGAALGLLGGAPAARGAHRSQPPSSAGGCRDPRRLARHLAEIENFRIHDLRHTCAAWLVSAGVPLPEVRDLLGHSTIRMTERYAHLAPENVRAAVARLEGKAAETEPPNGGGESRSGHVTSRVIRGWAT
jgi:hypothetical protein